MKKHLPHPRTLLLSIFCLSLFIFSATAQQTKKISLQGFLKDANGKAVADGDQSLTFKIYTVASGGTAIWSEDQTLKVFGGVYSASLGKTVDIAALAWDVPYYVGVTIQGSELTPRTELTYAPYSFGTNKAQEVVCSGAVGDVKYSILAPDDFVKVNGSCWVPMDGRSLAPTDKLRLAVTGGLTQIPDGSGAFIRSQEFAGKADRDPNRTSTSPIATLQSDDLGSHAHSASLSVSGSTSTGGDHNHGFPYPVSRADTDTGGSNNVSGGDGTALTFSSTNSAGSHAHSISGTASGSTSNAGGSETRPKNLNFWTYIRIN
ncbi:MAG: hypothetical protein V4585_01135 [Bacteroidota bacterium]